MNKLKMVLYKMKLEKGDFSMNSENEQLSGPQNYQEFLAMLRARFNSFFMEAEEGRFKKAAALRARKLAMDLRIELKNFRELSILHDRASK